MTTQRALASLAMAMAATVLVAATQTSTDPARALRAAIEAEVIHADVERAVAEYRRLAAGSDQAVAAQALLRLAHRQAIAGDPDARTTYGRVLEGFPTDTAAVAEATARLADLDAEQNGAQQRLVWDEAEDLWGSVSLDGRWLSFVDWDTGDLALRDLTSGQNRRLTNYGGFTKAQGEVEANAISPDGRRIAFTWTRWDERASDEGYVELRVIGADGSNERMLLRGKDYTYLEPQAWSPDGTRIALHVDRPRPAGQPARPSGDVVVVDADGGNVRVLASYSESQPWRIRFSPDGQWITYDLRTGGPQFPGFAVSGIAVVKADGSGEPAVLIEGGSTMGWTPSGSQVLFTKERLGVREFFAQPFAGGRVTGNPVRLSPIGDLGEPMGMTADGRLFTGLSRRAEDAVLATYDATTGSVRDLEVLRPVRGMRGARSSCAPQFSPDGSQLAMVTSPEIIVIRDVASGAERVVRPALEAIRAFRWDPDGQSLLVAASDGSNGLFDVDLATHEATLELRTTTPTFGVSPDGQSIYYRQPGEPVSKIVARDRRNGATREVAEWTDAIIDIVPSPDGLTLALTGSRKLVFVDLRTGTSSVRWEGAEVTNERVREGTWTADGRTFVTMFASNDETGQELWSVPASDGPIRRHALESRVRGLSMGSDGRLATMRVERVDQLWVLENFLPAGIR